jgi:competence CoiA-like predicted nuclease
MTALVDGDLKDATQMTEEQWARMKRARPAIAMACCGVPGFMRESSQGTLHFVHCRPSETCTSGPETPAHDALKNLVARAARSAGWQAAVEQPDPTAVSRWRADVLATRGSAKVALEIQLSSITSPQLERRHRLYEESGVRACWFLGPTPHLSRQTRYVVSC